MVGGFVFLAMVGAVLFWANRSLRQGKLQRARITLVFCLMLLMMFSIITLLGTNLLLPIVSFAMLVGTFIGLARISPPATPPAFDGYDGSAGYHAGGVPRQPITTISDIIDHIETGSPKSSEPQKDLQEDF